MFKIKKLFVIFLAVFLLTTPALGNENQKYWAVMGDNTKVYGYWRDVNNTKVFIECDPATNKPTGYAYLDTSHYELKEMEDTTAVKKVRPVVIENIFAPNIPSSIGVDYDHYYETGEIRLTSKYSVTWPGDSSARIVPNNTPEDWLIVAQVRNPNPFPVKANVNIAIKSSDPSCGFNSEIEFGPNETKYVKINDKPLNHIKDRWGTFKNGNWQDGWSKVYSGTSLKENKDPELPPALRPNLGYINPDCTGKLSSSCFTSEWDVTGPIIIGYQGKNLDSYEENWDDRKMYTLKSPNFVGWHEDKLPVLTQEPIFITRYEFVPKESPNVGILKKTVKPGYYLSADTLEIPKFQQQLSLINWNKEYLSYGRSPKVRYTFNYNVKVNAINNTDYDCKFTSPSNIRFYLPTLKYLKNYIQTSSVIVEKKYWGAGETLEKVERWYREPTVSDAEFDIADSGQRSITIPKHSTISVVNKKVQLTFELEESHPLYSASFEKFFDTRDAALIGNNFSFELIPDDTLVGIGIADMRYKYTYYFRGELKRDKDYTEGRFGNPYGISLVSYLSQGMPLFPSDPLYTRIINSGQRYKITFPNSSSYVESNFWPVATLPDNSLENAAVSPEYLYEDNAFDKSYTIDWESTRRWEKSGEDYH